jgi:hypothetical protein
MEEEVKMAEIDPDCVRGENREEGKAKGAIGLGPRRLVKYIHERGSKEF